MPGYMTVDFSLAYDYDNKTTFTANGMNLLNQGYYTDGGSSSTTPTMGMPRLVMVGMRYKF
jgi:outer membrane receptor protein involved in Fe transport